jgi:hypothetical protein
VTGLSTDTGDSAGFFGIVALVRIGLATGTSELGEVRGAAGIPDEGMTGVSAGAGALSVDTAASSGIACRDGTEEFDRSGVAGWAAGGDRSSRDPAPTMRATTAASAAALANHTARLARR